MRQLEPPTIGFALLVVFASVLSAGDPASSNWPRFRGPGARGVAEGAATPTSWDVAQGRNIQWTTPVPGLAHSSPVVWGYSVF